MFLSIHVSLSKFQRLFCCNSSKFEEFLLRIVIFIITLKLITRIITIIIIIIIIIIKLLLLLLLLLSILFLLNYYRFKVQIKETRSTFDFCGHNSGIERMENIGNEELPIGITIETIQKVPHQILSICLKDVKKANYPRKYYTIGQKVQVRVFLLKYILIFKTHIITLFPLIRTK